MMPLYTPCSHSVYRMCNRRHLMKFGLMTLAMSTKPPLALASPPAKKAVERTLDLYQTHTGERLKTAYWADGQYLPDALSQLNHLLRDYRTGDIQSIDPRLLDLLHALATKLEASDPFHILSAYRSRTPNARLRQRRHGVSKQSFHLYGQAIDFYLPQCDLAKVRRAAWQLRKGGIGYYPNAHFLHVDTGPVRSWQSAYSRPAQNKSA